MNSIDLKDLEEICLLIQAGETDRSLPAVTECLKRLVSVHARSLGYKDWENILERIDG